MIKEKLTQYIEDTIKENWDINAFADYGKDRIIKYSDVAKNILIMHNIFKRSSIYKGDKIALCGGNSINWALTYLSIISYGAVVIPILVDFSPNDISSIIKDSGTKYLFIDKNIADKIDGKTIDSLDMVFSLDDFSIISVDNNIYKEIRRGDNLFNIEPENFSKETFSLNIFDNETLATIIYTSGTTGFSKGVMLNHNALAANIRFAIANMPIKPNDNILFYFRFQKALAYIC